ncbi:MAG: EamA family transporter, partial [Oscillospiraceae bacterium]|nr:EamA family transporter [Oscillospiraceae bacterium]
MKKRNPKQVFLPLLTAFIWGSSFVAQSLSVGHLGAFTFNMARSFAAVAALGLMLLILRLKNGDARSAEEKRTERKDLLIGGICCGVFLTLGSNLQQLGIEQTAAGKAGFIT